MLKQPGDQVKHWSPAFIDELLDYYLAFPYLGKEKVIGNFKNENKQSEMVSIDDIIPL